MCFLEAFFCRLFAVASAEVTGRNKCAGSWNVGQVGFFRPLAKRLLSSLVVKPENMWRNLERGGGAVLSEAVMMALAEKIGRDRAHELVLQIAREASRKRVAFRDAVASHPEVTRRLSRRKLAAALDYEGSLGLAGHFVDQVVAAYRARRPRRRA